MSVLVTLIALAIVAAWLLMVYRRLTDLRQQVVVAWKKLETDLSNEAIKNVYNRHVKIYNDALGSFPAYLIAPAAGFKPARTY